MTHTPTTQEQRAELRRLAAAATPGPWWSNYDDNGFYHLQAKVRPSPYIAATGGEGDLDEANAAFIAAAREALPRLLDDLAAAEAALAAETERCARIAEQRANYYRDRATAVEKDGFDEDGRQYRIECATLHNIAKVIRETPYPTPGIDTGAVEKARPASPDIQKYIAGVIGVVEANSFETLCLWKEHPNADARWKQAPWGPLVEIGQVDGRPIWVSLLVHTIDGDRVLFIDATSQIVDHKLIDEWLHANLPASARRTGWGLPQQGGCDEFPERIPRPRRPRGNRGEPECTLRFSSSTAMTTPARRTLRPN